MKVELLHFYFSLYFRQLWMLQSTLLLLVNHHINCLSKFVLKTFILLFFLLLCWFSPGSSVSSNKKTDRHDITEILLKVALNTINQPSFIVQKDKKDLHIKSYDKPVLYHENILIFCYCSRARTLDSIIQGFKMRTSSTIFKKYIHRNDTIKATTV